MTEEYTLYPQSRLGGSLVRAPAHAPAVRARKRDARLQDLIGRVFVYIKGHARPRTPVGPPPTLRGLLTVPPFLGRGPRLSHRRRLHARRDHRAERRHRRMGREPVVLLCSGQLGSGMAAMRVRRTAVPSMASREAVEIVRCRLGARKRKFGLNAFAVGLFLSAEWTGTGSGMVTGVTAGRLLA